MSKTYSTSSLSIEQKQELYNKYQSLIKMIHLLGKDMMLRKQIKKLYHCLHPEVSEKEIDFWIADLIHHKFLIQKQIHKASKTNMLYLSKFPRSFFCNKEKSGDVPALNFTNNKIYQSIFSTDYILTILIPRMKQNQYEISIENILVYLQYEGSNFLRGTGQIDITNFYIDFYNSMKESGFQYSFDFLRDAKISLHESKSYAYKFLHQGNDPGICQDKIMRDKEKDSYLSEIEQQKYYYNFNIFCKSGFIFEGFEGNILHISYFDINNNIQVKKLWTTLAYIFMMFQRYLDNNEIYLEAHIYVWDEQRMTHLLEEEGKKAFDFKNKELKETPKSLSALEDVGLLYRYYDHIRTSYYIDDIWEYYHIPTP